VTEEKSGANPVRLLREVRLFDAKLGPIDGAGNVGSHLIGLVVSKPVAQPAQSKQEEESKKNVEKTEPTEEDAEKPSTDTT
jgi:vacuolar protein sorting-associated protein 54